MTAPRREILSWLGGLAFVLGAIALVYRRALECDFQFDDVTSILEHAPLRDLGRFVRNGFLAELCNGGRAVTDLTLALDHAVAGWDPQQFHATNVTLHLATVAGVWLFTARLLRSAGSSRPELWALAVAGIWGVHPLQTEAVTYVCQRAEILAALFAVGATWLLVAADAREGTVRGRILRAAAFLVFVLGLAAKQNAAVVPLLYLLHVLCFGGRGTPSWKHVLLRASPFAAVVIVGAMKVLPTFARRADIGFDIPGMTVSRYALTQPRVIGNYVRLLLWPAGQNFDWHVRISTEPYVRSAVAALLLVGVVAGAGWLLVRARSAAPDDARAARLAAFGTGWFFVTLAPTSSILPLADLMVEHRVYLPSWGVVLVLAAAAQWLVSHSRGRLIAAAVLAGVAFVSLGVATRARNAVWRTHETLWSDAVAKSPLKPRPHVNLGEALWQRGAFEASLAESRAALSLDDGSMPSVERARAYQNMSAALGQLGQYEESVAAALKGFKLQPKLPLLLTNLIESYRAIGDLDNARRYAAILVELQPRKMEVHNAYGQLLMTVSDVPSALREFEIAAALEPAAFEPAVNTALAYEKLGAPDKACEWWSRVSVLAPRSELRSAAAARQREMSCVQR